MQGNETEIATGLLERSKIRKSDKPGEYIHDLTIRREIYRLTSINDWSLYEVGDNLRFEYIPRRRGVRSDNNVHQIIETTIQVLLAAEQSKLARGHVYILSNVTFPALLKIGYTEGLPTARAKGLSANTGIPTKFIVEWSLAIDGDPRLVERRVHLRLSSHRQGKEFFRVSLDRAQKEIIGAYADLYPQHGSISDSVLTARENKIKNRREAELERLAKQRNQEKNLERISFEQTSQHMWAVSGRSVVVIEDFAPKLVERRKGLLSRFLSPVLSNPDCLLIRVVADINSRGSPEWRLIVSGRSEGIDIERLLLDKFGNVALHQSSFSETCRTIRYLIDRIPYTSRRIQFEINNHLMDIDHTKLPTGLQFTAGGTHLKSFAGMTIRGEGKARDIYQQIMWANAQ